MALAISILGRTELAIRLPTAIASSGTVFAVFWLGWLLFGRDERSGAPQPWRGLFIGGLSAGLLAVSLGQTIIGRTSFRVNFLPLLLTLCLALLWLGWSRRNWRHVALAGACAGLLAYTYIAARFTPFLFLSFGLSLLIPWARSEKEEGFGLLAHRFSSLKSRLRAEWPLVCVFVCVSSLLAAPILVYFALNPIMFFLRSSQVSVFQPGSGIAGLLAALVENVWEHLLAFGIRGDPSWRHNYAGQPLLNTWEAFFFWLGLGTAAWRWKQPSLRLLLLWLALLLLPAFLSRDNNVPHFLRMHGATPAMYLLTSFGAWETIRFLQDRLHWRQVNWVPGLRREGAKAVTVVCAVVGFILIQGGHTYRAYFQEWAASPDIGSAYERIWTDLALALNEHPSTGDTVYLVGLLSNYSWHYEASTHPSFEFLYTGAAETRIIHATATHNLASKIESALAQLEQVSTVHYVDWDNTLVGGNVHSDKLVTTVLEKYGRYLKSEGHDGFQIHSYADIDLERPWTFYEHLEPLTIHYDGGISFLGFALGQGSEQLSLTQQFDLDQDRPWWIATHWQTATGLEAIYSISLRLHDAGGGIAYQHDAVLKNSLSRTTNRWLADELVDSLHFLEVPLDLPPGDYELRLVVYDFETLKPTVELGVWEPETLLATLKVANDR